MASQKWLNGGSNENHGEDIQAGVCSNLQKISYKGDRMDANNCPTASALTVQGTFHEV